VARSSRSMEAFENRDPGKDRAGRQSIVPPR
jgi:hypothetical protein